VGTVALAVGSRVGSRVGSALGTFEAFPLALMLGFAEGSIVGSSVGSSLGSSEGSSVGSRFLSSFGPSDVLLLGSSVRVLVNDETFVSAGSSCFSCWFRVPLNHCSVLSGLSVFLEDNIFETLLNIGFSGEIKDKCTGCLTSSSFSSEITGEDNSTCVWTSSPFFECLIILGVINGPFASKLYVFFDKSEARTRTTR